MPSFEKYKHQLGKQGRTLGEVRKNEADDIMLQTWDGDIASRVAYVYDFYHDSNPRVLRDLHPTEDINKIPLDIKYIKHTSQTMDKDAITYHLQMKPGQLCNVPYYEKYEQMYDMEWPLGLYCDIENESGVYNRWLIVAKADSEAPQFPTYELLKCDYTFQYIMNGKKMEVAGVLRSQNSYNSGIWTDYKTTAVEDQQKFLIPLNRETEKIYYDLRMIIDAKVLTEPRAWHVSKVNRISSNGLIMVTLAQNMFDQHRDYIELDSNGNVSAMWASYWDTTIEPTLPPEEPVSIYSEIIYSGATPQLKVGGSYKKLSVNFYDEVGEIPFKQGSWSFEIDNEDASDLITTLLPDSSKDLDENQIKVKFTGDAEYIGKNLVVSYVSASGIKSSILMDIVGL